MDLFVARGDTLRFTVTLTNPDGSAYDLTGATVRCTVKRSVRDPDSGALASLWWVSGGTASGISVSSPASGIAVVTVPGTTTATWDLAPLAYDVQVSRGGDTWTVLVGHVHVTADVTLTSP